MLTIAMIPALCSILAAPIRPDDPNVLLNYRCDEGEGTSVAGGLPGVVSAGWAPSPRGFALSFNGQPDSIVRVAVPEAARLGRGSWTFCAWLKPVEFSYPDPQNQRRVFSYGVFPDANIVLDILSNGQPTYYFCYKDAQGNVHSAGGTADGRLRLDAWAHVALVCDRDNRVVRLHINGIRQCEDSLPADFDGDFSLGGELTLGSSWHNYHGLMDEVLLVRRALSPTTIRNMVEEGKEAFGVTISEEERLAEERLILRESLARLPELFAERRWDEARKSLKTIMDSEISEPSAKAYAHLRLAQSYADEGRLAEAQREYERVAAQNAYPRFFRDEAADLLGELKRRQRGLPPRDFTDTRVRVTQIRQYLAEVIVAPDGHDRNDGRTKPVATLARARDVVRQLRRNGVRGAIAVTIRPGTYAVTSPLRLTKEDSGTANGPTVYRAARAGSVVFYGGRRITGFAPVTDPGILERLPEEARGKVYQCDLRRQGITDFGKLAVRGFSQPPSPPTLEVFFNKKPLTLARWPNKGFVGIKRLVEPGNRDEGKPSVFEYIDDRHARWTKAEEPWLFGYFRYLWADATIRVTRIDPETRTVICGEAYQYGPPGMDTGQGIQYYAFNLLEEIDEPGEWYLDRARGILYLYPPSDPNKAVVEVGLLSVPMLVAENVQHVRLEGLTFDLGRFNALEFRNCSHVLIAGCTVSRFAGNGIMVHDGEQVGILSCHIHTIGRRATEVIGGDRKTLRPARHFVENCEIHDFGRIDRTYTPAIQLEGVGNRAAHNLMYNCPSSVMRVEGNDHIIEFNEVHSAVRESDDQGAMELFGNPTYRGVVFRFNRYVDCGKRDGAQVHGQAAIRLDDVISGILIYGNVFVRSANGHFGAVQINSGRDNIIANNLFVDCARGISGGWYPNNVVWQQVARGENPDHFIVNDLYLQRYPEMVDMLKEPGINRVWRNVFLRCGPMVTGNRVHLDLIGNLEADATAPSVEAAVKEAAIRIGFRSIPFDHIGLYRDRYRRSVSPSVPFQP